MRFLLVTEEMEQAARQVLAFPHFSPGNLVPRVPAPEQQLLAFVRLMADAVLDTRTGPAQQDSVEPGEPAAAPPARRAKRPTKTARAVLATLTLPQQYALERMPADWFCSESLTHLHGAEAICQRLVKKGLVEQRSACPPGENFLEWVRSVPHTRLHEYRRLP